MITHRIEGQEIVLECDYCKQELDRQPKMLAIESPIEWDLRFKHMVRHHFETNHFDELSDELRKEHCEAATEIKRDLKKWFPHLNK